MLRHRLFVLVLTFLVLGACNRKNTEPTCSGT